MNKETSNVTAKEVWPEVRVIALAKLAQATEQKCGITNIYLHRNFGLTDKEIANFPDICFEDDELNCSLVYREVEFYRR